MFGALPLRTPQELLLMREAGRIVGQVLDHMRQLAAPGVTTLDLDAEAERIIRERGGRPAFKGYRVAGRPAFPATLCTSVNDVVVHGIPGKRPLKEGDILSIDVGVEYQGFYGDTAVTLAIGRVSKQAGRLMAVCSEALDLAIAEMKPGNALSKIGKTVQRHVEANGFSVVRDFVGHGIGAAMHQAPEVPNYATSRGDGVRLEPGLVLAIEPMINAGRHAVEVDVDDRWTVRTADGSLSAHFEHTVAVTPDGPSVLTLP
jgi:methionyl aminopeptidase